MGSLARSDITCIVRNPIDRRIQLMEIAKMNNEWFDDLTKMLGRVSTRRSYLRWLTGALGGGTLALATAGRANAADEVTTFDHIKNIKCTRYAVAPVIAMRTGERLNSVSALDIATCVGVLNCTGIHIPS